MAYSLLPMRILGAGASGDMSSLANPRYRFAYAPAGACLLDRLMRYGAVAVTGTVALLTVSGSLSPPAPWQLARLGSSTDSEWREKGLYLMEHLKPGEAILRTVAEWSLASCFCRPMNTLPAE